MKASRSGSIKADGLAATSAGLSAEAEARLAELLDAHLQQLERGEPASAEALIAEHPSLAGPLRRYLTSLNLVHRAVRDEPSRPEDALPCASATSEAMSMLRHHLGDYQLDREIGRGGMGVVYEATQLSLGRRVALKVLPFAAVLDDRQIARFQNEAKAAALLHHPHIVPVYGVGCERGVHYYSMQFIEGQSLDRIVANLRHQAPRPESGSRGGRSRWNLSRRRVAKSPGSDTWPQGAATELTRSWSESTSIATSHYVRSIVELIQHVAEALDYAHAHGVVHRDIKPSNLMIDRHGKVWITDFGLARLETGRDLTLTGELVGTLRYMSPEQATGRSRWIDARTDVYSLGVTLYELLTLRPACEGSDRHEVIRRIEHEWPTSCRILNRAVGSDLETILFKAMAKSRDDRYETAREMADDLQRYLAGQPIRARRATWMDHSARYVVRHARWCASLCVAGLLAIGILAASQYQMLRHHRALHQAQQRADLHLQVAHQVVDDFGSRVADELSSVPGAARIRQAWLAQTLEYYQSFAQYAQADPRLAADLGRTQFHAAAIAQRLGQLDRALAAYEQARGHFAQRAHVNLGDRDARADQALCDNNLGTLHVQRGQLDQAAIAYERAFAVQQQLVASDAATPRWRAELGLTLYNRGRLRKSYGAVSVASAERLFGSETTIAAGDY